MTTVFSSVEKYVRPDQSLSRTQATNSPLLELQLTYFPWICLPFRRLHELTRLSRIPRYLEQRSYNEICLNR